MCSRSSRPSSPQGVGCDPSLSLCVSSSVNDAGHAQAHSLLLLLHSWRVSDIEAQNIVAPRPGTDPYQRLLLAPGKKRLTVPPPINSRREELPSENGPKPPWVWREVCCCRTARHGQSHSEDRRRGEWRPRRNLPGRTGSSGGPDWPARLRDCVPGGWRQQRVSQSKPTSAADGSGTLAGTVLSPSFRRLVAGHTWSSRTARYAGAGGKA